MSQKTNDSLKALIADLPVDQSIKSRFLVDLAGGKTTGEVVASIKVELAKLSPEDAAVADKIDAMYDAESDAALAEFDKEMTSVEEDAKQLRNKTIADTEKVAAQELLDA